MNLSQSILKLVKENDGIKSAKIAKTLNSDIATVSGILSYYKRRRKIMNTMEGLWHVIKKADSLIKFLDRINSEKYDRLWSEGYISALADYDIISDDEFDTILTHIINKTSE